MPAYRIASHAAAKEEKEAYLHFDNFFPSLRFNHFFFRCPDRFIICDRKKRNWITGTL